MAAGKRSETTALVVGGGFAGIACAKHLGEARRARDARRPARLHPVPTAAVPGRDRAGERRPTWPDRSGRSSASARASPCGWRHRERRSRRQDRDERRRHLVRRPTTWCWRWGRSRTSSTRRAPTTHAFPLYSLDDAERLRSRLFDVLEDALPQPEAPRPGCAELRDRRCRRDRRRDRRRARRLLQPRDSAPHPSAPGIEAARIHLIDPGAGRARAVLRSAPTSTRRRRSRRWASRSSSASRSPRSPPTGSCSPTGARSSPAPSCGRAGSRRPTLASSSGIPQGHGGRFDVAADLTCPGLPGVYALGDVANTPGPDGKPFPQLGSVALQAGRWAADNILADIDGKPRADFHYKDKGIMAMIGRNAAVAEVGPKRRELHGVARVRVVARRARLAAERLPRTGQRARRRGDGTTSPTPAPRRSSIGPTRRRSTGTESWRRAPSCRRTPLPGRARGRADRGVDCRRCSYPDSA